MGKKKKNLKKKKKNSYILGAKNHRKYLHKHPGPPFQIRGGPGSFSIAQFQAMSQVRKNNSLNFRFKLLFKTLKA